MEDTQSSEIFLNTCKEYLENIVNEYCTLSVLNELTERQAVRTAEILKQAEADPMLSFLLDEADHVIGHLMGMVDVAEIRAEQDILRHIIDQNWIAWSIQQGLNNNSNIINPTYTLEEAQAYLKQQGLYEAKIDGVCGKKTKQAFQQLERKFHQHLRKHGFYPETAQDSQDIETNEAIKMVQEKGIDGEIKDNADFLRYGTGLSFC